MLKWRVFVAWVSCPEPIPIGCRTTKKTVRSHYQVSWFSLFSSKVTDLTTVSVWIPSPPSGQGTHYCTLGFGPFWLHYSGQCAWAPSTCNPIPISGSLCMGFPSLVLQLLSLQNLTQGLNLCPCSCRQIFLMLVRSGNYYCVGTIHLKIY